jgi:hypothetical protein
VAGAAGREAVVAGVLGKDFGGGGRAGYLGKTQFRPGDTPRATLGLPIEVDPIPTRCFDPRLGFEYPEGIDFKVIYLMVIDFI